MNEMLRPTARELASRPYAIVISENDTLNGDPIFVLYNPELPGCIAHGATIQDAQNELQAAREDYILSLLEDNLSIPLPQGYAVQSTVNTANTTTMVFSIASNLSTRTQAQPMLKLTHQDVITTPFNYPPQRGQLGQEADSESTKTSIVPACIPTGGE